MGAAGATEVSVRLRAQLKYIVNWVASRVKGQGPGLVNVLSVLSE